MRLEPIELQNFSNVIPDNQKPSYPQHLFTEITQELREGNQKRLSIWVSILDNQAAGLSSEQQAKNNPNFQGLVTLFVNNDAPTAAAIFDDIIKSGARNPHYANALANRAFIYFKCTEPADLSKAKTLYEEAITLKHAGAQYTLGRILENEDAARAQILFTYAAAQGHPSAMNSLIKSDTENEIDLLTKASELGHPYAKVNLAAHEWQYGKTKIAISLLISAAYLGLSLALTRLAKLCTLLQIQKLDSHTASLIYQCLQQFCSTHAEANLCLARFEYLRDHAGRALYFYESAQRLNPKLKEAGFYRMLTEALGISTSLAELGGDPTQVQDYIDSSWDYLLSDQWKPCTKIISCVANQKEYLTEKIMHLEDPIRYNLLKRAVDKNTILGKVFWLPRAAFPCSLDGGQLAKLMTEITRIETYYEISFSANPHRLIFHSDHSIELEKIAPKTTINEPSLRSANEVIENIRARAAARKASKATKAQPKP